MKGKYLGIIFCVVVVDVDDVLYLLVIVIVDVESDENWMWFMLEFWKFLGVNIDNMFRFIILLER